MFSFFTGRSNRQEYWISVALLIVVAFLLTALHMESASAAITIMWVITWLRRLHDIGRPGWWALAPIVLIIAVVIGGLALGGEPLVKALAAIQAMDTNYAMPDRIAYLLFGIGLAAVVIQFGFTIWLGAKKGDEGSNRFGAPPEDIIKRS
ncbi:MAG: DUF805 domain-containing protein [Proteobacteria bacterium]|nr:DUF805 domain-containing protein [Pseudomonadota bacterium]